MCSVGTDNLADMFNYAAILSRAAEPGFNLDQADGYLGSVRSLSRNPDTPLTWINAPGRWHL
jgi:hypothetical protein